MGVKIFEVLFVVMIQHITRGTTTVMDHSMHMIMMKNSEPTHASSTTENVLTPDLWESQYQPGDTFIKERVRSSAEQTDTEEEPEAISPVYDTAQTQFSDSEKPKLREDYATVYEKAQQYASDSEIPKLRENIPADYEKAQQYASDSEIPKLRVNIAEVYDRVPSNSDKATILQSHAYHMLDSEKSKLRPAVYESAQPQANHLSDSEKPKLRNEYTMIPAVYGSSQPHKNLKLDSEKVNQISDSDKPKLRVESTIPAALESAQPDVNHKSDSETIPSLKDVLRQGGTTKGAEQSDVLPECHSCPKVEVEDLSNSSKPLFPKPSPDRLNTNETEFSKISGKVKKYLDNWAFKVHNFYKT